jgi:tRNA nucleotidyltransferase/poly(A) polymerase
VSAPLELVREALAGTDAWIVGGTVRDRRLGRATDDLDIAVAGDPAMAAQRVRRAAGGGAAFELSDRFGAWRYVSTDRAWQLDVVALRDGDLQADLAARDFTVNAMAEPLAGGPPVDPYGGAADLEARLLRAVGERSFPDDPLRCLRAIRLVAELDLTLEPATAAALAAHAAGLAHVAPERVFAELKRIMAAERPRAALEQMSAYGVTAVILPELEALREVEQSVYHHRDVHDHTLEVLDATVLIGRDPAAAGLPRHADALRALLAEPLAEGLTRAGGMRFAALMHDIAKPETARRRLDGRGYGFPGHHAAGAEAARAILRRLRASERLVGYVAALTEHHLRLGFLVRPTPVEPREVHRYLQATGDVAADVTAFTVADRLATRGAQGPGGHPRAHRARRRDARVRVRAPARPRARPRSCEATSSPRRSALRRDPGWGSCSPSSRRIATRGRFARARRRSSAPGSSCRRAPGHAAHGGRQLTPPRPLRPPRG